MTTDDRRVRQTNAKDQYNSTYKRLDRIERRTADVAHWQYNQIHHQPYDKSVRHPSDEPISPENLNCSIRDEEDNRPKECNAIVKRQAQNCHSEAAGESPLTEDTACYVLKQENLCDVVFKGVVNGCHRYIECPSNQPSGENGCDGTALLCGGHRILSNHLFTVWICQFHIRISHPLLELQSICSSGATSCPSITQPCS